MAIGTHAVIVDIEKSQAVDDALRSKVVGISDILFDETLVLILRAEGLDIHADRLRHTDGIGDLDFTLLCVSGENDVPCTVLSAVPICFSLYCVNCDCYSLPIEGLGYFLQADSVVLVALPFD